MRIRTTKIERSALPAARLGVAVTGADRRWSTSNGWKQSDALKAHRTEGLIATVTGIAASAVADRVSFQLRARTTGTSPTDVTSTNPWCRAFNISPGGEFTAAAFRKWLSLGLDYYGEAWVYQSASGSLTPVIGASVEAVQAQVDARDHDGTPRVTGGYRMRAVTGTIIGEFDAEGYETNALTAAGLVPVTGRKRGHIIRVHELDPASPIAADIRVCRAGMPVEVLTRTREYTAQVLENSAGKREVAYVSRDQADGALSDTQLSVIEDRLLAHARSVKGGLLSLPAEVKIVEVGSTDLAEEVSGVADRALRDILDVWQMPESLLGRGGARTYENQATELLQWTRSFVLDRLETIVSAINLWSMRYEGVELYWDTSGSQVLAEAFADSTERAAAMWDRDAITLNEFRRMSGLEPVEGPDGDMRKSELAPAPVVPPFPGQTQEDPNPSSPPEPDGVASPQTTERQAAAPEPDWDGLAADLDRASDDAAGELADTLQALLDRVASTAAGAARRRAGVTRADDTTASPPVPQDLGIDDLINAAGRTAELADDLPAIYERLATTLAQANYEATATRVPAMASRLADPANAATRWARVITAQRDRLVVGDPTSGYHGMVASIRDDIEEQLLIAKGRGESVDQLTARIYDRLDTGLDEGTRGARAEAIARTESASLQNALAEEQWSETGLVKRKRWYNIADNRTRASHAALAGTTVAWNDKFDVGGTMAARPHDPALPASEVINCRCRLIPLTS